jgi:hypothetical protein
MPRAQNRVMWSVETVTTALSLDQERTLWLMAKCRNIQGESERLEEDRVETLFILEAHALVKSES